MVRSNSTYSTLQAPLENLNKELSRLFPRIRAKPLHRSFYEFKSKLNPFHGARSNRYKHFHLSFVGQSFKSILYTLSSLFPTNKTFLSLAFSIIQLFLSNTTLKPFWLMLSKSCFKPSTNNTFSMKVKESLPIVPLPIISPFLLSPKVTKLPPSWKDSQTWIDYPSCVLSNHCPSTTYFFLEAFKQT